LTGFCGWFALVLVASRYERPLGLGREALALEKAAFQMYRLLLGDKHHLTVRVTVRVPKEKRRTQRSARAARAHTRHQPTNPEKRQNTALEHNGKAEKT
jgi:hypothetical protein